MEGSIKKVALISTGTWSQGAGAAVVNSSLSAFGIGGADLEDDTGNSLTTNK